MLDTFGDLLTADLRSPRIKRWILETYGIDLDHDSEDEIARKVREYCDHPALKALMGKTTELVDGKQQDDHTESGEN